MNLIDQSDELVSNVGLYRSRHPLLHGYTSPFIPLYLSWLYLWFVVYGYEEWLEAGAVIGAVLVILNILVILSCYWPVHFLALMTCSKVDPKNSLVAEWAKVVPTENNGSPELVKLALKCVWDTDKKVLRRVQFPTDGSHKSYRDWKGWGEEQEVRDKTLVYGSNAVDMTIPELFIERAIAPFFMFQVFCVGLWCLDEYWYYSVFILMMRVVFECTRSATD